MREKKENGMESEEGKEGGSERERVNFHESTPSELLLLLCLCKVSLGEAE